MPLRALTILALALSVSAGDIVEPRSACRFEATMPAGDATLCCTGTGLRSKVLVKVFAAAHYHAPTGDWPAAAAERSAWIRKSSDAKGLRFHILFGVGQERVRRATEEMLDAQAYRGPSRDAFIAAAGTAWSKGMRIEYCAAADGTLSYRVDGETLGEWQDRALINALWNAWFGDEPVVDDPALLLAQPPSCVGGARTP